MRIPSLVIAGMILSSIASATSSASIDRYIVVNHSLVRGGQPTTEDDFHRLRREGIKTVINLRTLQGPKEWERKIVEDAGMNFRTHAIDGMSYPSAKTIQAALRDIRDPSLQPVFVHCHAGKDRTGLVVGLYRVFFQQWRPADAYEEMLRIGFDPNLVGLRNYFWDHAKLKRPRH